MVKYILTSTYFCFGNNIYKQIFGTPMGSPLSPVLADLVLQDIENKALYRIGFKLPLFFRYVDDIILAVPNDHVNKITEIFNSFHERIQFTYETEVDRSISFLELNIKRDDNKLILDWFHKNTFLGRYLSFFSGHPLCHKIGTIYSLVDRAVLLSQPQFHRKNIIFCIDTLLENNFPLPLIFKHVSIRIKKLLATKLNNKLSETSLVNNVN